MTTSTYLPHPPRQAQLFLEIVVLNSRGLSIYEMPVVLLPLGLVTALENGQGFPLDLEYKYTNYSLWRLLPLEQVFSLIAPIYIYKPEIQSSQARAKIRSQTKLLDVSNEPPQMHYQQKLNSSFQIRKFQFVILD
jgi:hypothetical protein